MYKYFFMLVCCMSLHASESEQRQFVATKHVPGKNIEAVSFVPSQHLLQGPCNLATLVEIKKRLQILPGNQNHFGEKFVTNRVNAQAAFDEKGMSYMALVDANIDPSITKEVSIENMMYQVKRSYRNNQLLVEFHRKDL